MKLSQLINNLIEVAKSCNGEDPEVKNACMTKEIFGVLMIPNRDTSQDTIVEII